MRRALMTAAAVAPLLAAIAGTAFAACPSAGTTTSSAGNIDIASGCNVAPPANGTGVVLNSDNSVTIESGGTIDDTDKSNATGVLIDTSGGAVTGSVTNDGAITLSMSYQATDHNGDGYVGGAFATGTDRTGILVSGSGGFVGDITIASGAAVTVDGDNSYGVSLTTTVTGDLVDAGTITVLGNQTVGINVAGAMSGNVTITGAVGATGVGAQAVVITGDVGGQIDISNDITSTAYRATTAPTSQTILGEFTADQVEQSGSAVVIGGNVAGGILINAASTTGTGTSAVTVPAGAITTYGSGPALVVGASGKAITIGPNSDTDSYGLEIDGSVAAAGLYEQKTTPNLPAPVNATAVVLGDGGDLDLSGGVHVGGTVSATALDAQAMAIEIGAGTTGAAFANDGTVEAVVSADNDAGVASALMIDSGASIGQISNTGSITASVTDSVTTSSAAYAIVDDSGTVTSITNTGQITAELVPTSDSFVLTGPTVAIDVSNSQNGVSITQSSSTTYEGAAGPSFTGSISGTTLTVTAVASGNLVVGETLYGPGITTATTITAEGTGTGGTGTYTISTSQKVSSESMTAAGALPSITGDILFGAATVDQPNSLTILAGTTKGAVTEVVTATNANGDAISTDRNLDITVDNATVDITTAELHQVTTLDVGSTGVLEAAIDPSFAIGGSDETPIFDTTVHSGQTGPDGTATFADGAEIGITLDALQTAQSATYVFVHTSGNVGALNVGNLDETLLADSPYLYTAVASVDGGDLDVTVTLKTPQQMGLNASGSAAFDAVFAALENDSKIADAIIQPTTKWGFLQLYNQMLPDEGVGTFDALEAATEKISDLTQQTPDAGTRIAGGSAWLQEVNETVKVNDGDIVGSTDTVFGLVGGAEKMGAGGGALGVSLAYLNIQNVGTFDPVGAQVVTNLVEIGGYYRRAWGGLRLSARVGGGYAWFNEDRMFVTTGVSETATGRWNGFFGDGHLGAAYEVHFGRFYVRPELDADYIYLNEAAHSDTGASEGFDISVDQRVSERMTGAALVSFGAQYGHDAWFRPEVFGGYREVLFGDIANTVAQFPGGDPFTLSPGDSKGGWFTAGFALKAGTPLSYVAIVGETELRNGEQIYDVYLSGRAMF